MAERNAPKHATYLFGRRDFLRLGSGAVALLAEGTLARKAFAGRTSPRPRARNILLIFTDQQHIETIAAGGCPHVRTPSLDRLVRSGVSFTQSYTANPVCSPARSAVLTGRTSCETGVYVNGRAIRSDIPNLGQWFSQQADHQTVYAGKWHLPRSYSSKIPGFEVINTGIGGFGYLCDAAVSRACEGFLRNRSRSRPFLMMASFMQPHDICEWLRLNMQNPGQLRYGELAGKLPELPDNFDFDKSEPQAVKQRRLGNEPAKGAWSKEHWRYYRWSYYRNIENLDAEIGRILQALEVYGYLEDTLIALTSDHGEGMAHHQMVRKNTLYNEAARVPLIFSWPGHIQRSRIDSAHLVSGLDIMPTLCDYAGIGPPQDMRGVSLRPILEGKSTPGRDFIITEVQANTGRMVRTNRYKYVTYIDEPRQQLFDMKGDPGETRNLAADARHASVVADHQKLLYEWESRLDVARRVPHRDAWRDNA